MKREAASQRQRCPSSGLSRHRRAGAGSASVSDWRRRCCSSSAGGARGAKRPCNTRGAFLRRAGAGSVTV
eukprot:4319896-Pyramimonas_sp.AAC.1